jgi:hypothetical protein
MTKPEREGLMRRLREIVGNAAVAAAYVAGEPRLEPLVDDLLAAAANLLEEVQNGAA